MQAKPIPGVMAGQRDAVCHCVAVHLGGIRIPVDRKDAGQARGVLWELGGKPGYRLIFATRCELRFHLVGGEVLEQASADEACRGLLPRYDADDVLDLRLHTLKNPEDYSVRLLLDDNLAFTGRYQEDDLPF